MTVGKAMASAAMRLISRKPQAFFGSPDIFEQELCDLVNDVAKEIADKQDWQALKRVHTIAGDGVTEEFPFPADYERQLVNTRLQDPENWAFGYQHLIDMNDFLRRKHYGFEPFPGAWIIYNDKFHFSPAPHSGNAAVFPYITKNYGKNSSGAPISEFTADQDSFLLDERLLTLGLVFRWRENKKLDYTGDEERFNEALAEVGTKDGGSQIIRSGRRGLGRFQVAYPWALGPNA